MRTVLLKRKGIIINPRRCINKEGRFQGAVGPPIESGGLTPTKTRKQFSLSMRFGFFCLPPNIGVLILGVGIHRLYRISLAFVLHRLISVRRGANLQRHGTLREFSK